MRINTLKCEMEPAVAALQAELSIESVVATQSITNSHPQRYVSMYVCVFAIAPTCHCAARHKNWRHSRRRVEVEVVLMARCIRQTFQLKFKLMQTSGQAPFHSESLRHSIAVALPGQVHQQEGGGEGREVLLASPGSGPALTN